MSKTKSRFLFLDDSDRTTREGLVKYINSSSEYISIDTDYPDSWKNRSKMLLSEKDKYDGLILDWELTNRSPVAKKDCENAEDVDFSSEAIAEHIRISAAQKKIQDIPIIICSADRNKQFSKLRNKEQTSQDLFDLSFNKNEIFGKNSLSVDKQLHDLDITYKEIQRKKVPLHEFLALSKSQIDNFLDIRFLDKIETLLKEKTPHDLVQFFLREVIEREGVLIDDNVLAARLGIDKKITDKKDWDGLLLLLESSNVLNKGFLSKGWQRFWAFQLDEWWKELGANFKLKTSKAAKRVEFLNQKFELNLKVASRIEYCSSEEFWTVCFGTKRPLDPLDGFQISEYPQYPWQNPRFISAFAELEKEDTNAWKINVIDRNRYKESKSTIIEKQTK